MMEHYSQLLDISAERKRQVAEEGFTADHDEEVWAKANCRKG